jgi:uncharacterized protein YjbJ (UPF0337 family)
MENGKTDQAKGRIKQAAGDLTDDKDLKREGKVQVGAGKAKVALGDAKRAGEKVIDKAKDAVTRDR